MGILFVLLLLAWFVGSDKLSIHDGREKEIETMGFKLRHSRCGIMHHHHHRVINMCADMYIHTCTTYERSGRDGAGWQRPGTVAAFDV